LGSKVSIQVVIDFFAVHLKELERFSQIEHSAGIMGIVRTPNSRLAGILLIISSLVGAWALAAAPQAQVSPRPLSSSKPTKPSSPRKRADTTPKEPSLAARTEFTSACENAYVLSSGNSANVVSAGHILCRCAALESTVQGVTTPNMLAESAKIRQNPKYQIHDQHLLDSLRICLIEAYRENGTKPPAPAKKK
jgi:hypothetical protein